MVKVRGMEELLKQMMERALHGNEPFIYQGKNGYLVFPANAGLLFVPKPVFVYKFKGNVNKEKARELVKYDLMERIIWGLNNDWLEELEEHISKDFYIGSVYELKGKGKVFYLNALLLESKDFHEYMNYLMNLEPFREVGVGLDYFCDREKVLLRLNTTLSVREAESIDEGLERMERKMKDFAFEHPENFAIAKKLLRNVLFYKRY